MVLIWICYPIIYSLPLRWCFLFGLLIGFIFSSFLHYLEDELLRVISCFQYFLVLVWTLRKSHYYLFFSLCHWWSSCAHAVHIVYICRVRTILIFLIRIQYCKASLLELITLSVIWRLLVHLLLSRLIKPLSRWDSYVISITWTWFLSICYLKTRILGLRKWCVFNIHNLLFELC